MQHLWKLSSSCRKHANNSKLGLTLSTCTLQGQVDAALWRALPSSHQWPGSCVIRQLQKLTVPQSSRTLDTPHPQCCGSSQAPPSPVVSTNAWSSQAAPRPAWLNTKAVAKDGTHPVGTPSALLQALTDNCKVILTHPEVLLLAFGQRILPPWQVLMLGKVHLLSTGCLQTAASQSVCCDDHFVESAANIAPD